MAKNQKSYTEEFRREAARLMETSWKSVAQVARDLGVNDNMLYWWRKRYGKPAQTAQTASVDELATELQRARQDFEVVKQERDITKEGYQHCQTEPRMSYTVIEQHWELGDIETRCRALGVSVSGYCAYAEAVMTSAMQRCGGRFRRRIRSDVVYMAVCVSL